MDIVSSKTGSTTREFTHMLEDCHSRKMDIVLTESIRRFGEIQWRSLIEIFIDSEYWATRAIGDDFMKTNMQKVKRFWDKEADKYDSERSREQNKSYYQTIKRTSRYLKQSDVVLDIGCGTGTSTIVFARAANKVVGIDLSNHMIENAREKARKRQMTNIDFIVGTLEEQKIENEIYDAVIALNVLMLLDDIDLVLEKIKSILKPNGLFVSVTPCFGDRRNFLSIFISVLGKIGLIPSMNMLRENQLKEYVIKHGFNIIEEDCFIDSVKNCYLVAKKE